MDRTTPIESLKEYINIILNLDISKFSAERNGKSVESTDLIGCSYEEKEKLSKRKDLKNILNIYQVNIENMIKRM